MSDYTKVFDGVTKDNTTATVLGSEHDTEFDAISTAIGTKADKVTGATSGNLAELDANGNLVDSGFATSNLSSLTSPAQDQLDAITPAAQVTDYTAAEHVQMVDGSQTIALYSIDTNVTQSTWETFGPTGSTNALTEMDNWPSTARIGIFTVSLSATTNHATNPMTMYVYAAKGGVTPVVGFHTLIGSVTEDLNSTGLVTGHSFQCLIPLDSNLEFQIYWVSTDATSENVDIYPIGFIDGLH